MSSSRSTTPATRPAPSRRSRNIRNTVYRPGPDGLDNNDDLGAISSTFIWEMLGMYPENPGHDTLVFASPGFPHEKIQLGNGRWVHINAPGASPSRYYVQSLTINGQPHPSPWVNYHRLADGVTLNWTLGTEPTAWGSAPWADASLLRRGAAAGRRLRRRSSTSRVAPGAERGG